MSMVRAAVRAVPADPPEQWAEILTLARRGQVDTFLYNAMVGQKDTTPLNDCRLDAFARAAKYTLIAEQCRELFAAFNAAQIAVIPLKGTWLAERVYADGACRPMDDIDLLIKPEQVPEAVKVLEKLGYCSCDSAINMARDKHVAYSHPGRALTLELHWRLWYPSQEFVSNPTLDVWDRSGTELLHGASVSTMPLERRLIHLCHHIIGHAFAVPLRSYLDLTLFCKTFASQIDRQDLESEAQQWGVAFGAKFVLSIASMLGDLPETFKDDLGDQHAFAAQHKTLLLATLNTGGSPRMETPARNALQQHAWGTLFKVGLSRIFLTRELIRVSHPVAYRRCGLLGCYIARIRFLFGRQTRIRQMLLPGDHRNLDQIQTMRTLSEWLQDQEGKKS